MLQALRDQASSWVIKILLGLLILAFGIWGIGDMFLGGRDPVVAKVGGVEITRSAADNALREEINRLRPMFGNRFDTDAALRSGLAVRVLDRMVNRTALELAARDFGISVSDEMVNRHIRESPTFHDAQGKFSRPAFYAALQRAGMSESFYVHNLKTDLAATQVDAAAKSNIPVPDVLLDPLVRFRSEARSTRWMHVPLPPASAVAKPTEAELQAYYKKNTQRFMAPELRDVTFIHLDPLKLANDIRISDDRIKAAYKDRLDTYTIRDRRRVDQVVFKTEAAARTAAAEARSGKSLAAVAHENGKPLKVIRLGWVEKRDLISELAGPVFAASKGALVGPIKSGLGWHLVRVEDVSKGHTKPLSEVRDDLRKELASREALDDIFKIANRLEDALAGGQTIEEAAKSLNLKAQRVPAMNAGGQDPDGNPIAGLPPGEEFRRLAFTTQEGENSTLTETPAGGYFILHVNKVTQPAPRPLAAIHDEVVKAWVSAQRKAIARKRARNILERLKAGNKLTSIAAVEKLKIKTTKDITRLTHDADSGLPPALTDRLFAIKTGQATMAEAPGGFIVAVLTGIREAKDAERKKVAEQVREDMRTGMSADLFQELLGALRKRISISVYPERLKGQS